MQKECSKCGKVKDIGEFYFRKDIADFRKECKECSRQLNRKHYQETMAGVTLEDLMGQFVSKFETENIIDQILYKRILRKSKLWNKQEVLDSMVEQIQIFQDYDEDEGVQFNFKPYLEMLS